MSEESGNISTENLPPPDSSDVTSKIAIDACQKNDDAPGWSYIFNFQNYHSYLSNFRIWCLKHTSVFITIGKVECNDQRLKPEIEAKRKGKTIENINLGIVQKLAKVWLGKRETPVTTLNLTMLLKTCLSMSDTISDVHLALHLFLIGNWQWGLAIILIDYLPMWQVLLHTSTSKAWKELDDRKEQLLTVLILLFAPIAFPLFQIRWLVNLHKDKDDKGGKNNFLHQNCRVAELISGTVESPLQFMYMMIMYFYDVIPLPWSEDSIITDSSGNELNVGALPGAISLFLSSTSIVNNALDLSESKSRNQMLSYVSFSLTTCIFRLTGFVLAVVTFREFSSIMFVLIAFVALSIILRFEKESTKGFSLVTTFMIGIFIPCAVSEEPQNSQYQLNEQHQVDLDKDSDTSNKRRKLTAKIAMGSIPIIMLFNIVLLILITLTDYKLSSDMLSPDVSKATIKTLITLVVIPTGLFSFVGALAIRESKKDGQRKDPKKETFSTALHITMAVLTLCFVSGSIYKVVSGNIFKSYMNHIIFFISLNII